MERIYADLQQLPIVLNAQEVATVLRISRANAYVLMHSNAVHCIHIGKRMLLPKTELIKYIQENTESQDNA